MELDREKLKVKTPLKKGEPQEESIPYEPSEKQREVINRVYRRFEAMRTERDKSRRIFDGRTLKSYVTDCVDLYNGIVPDDIRLTKEDWQSLIFDHITRGKVKTIVSLVVGNAPYINVIGQTEEDSEYADEMKLVFDFEWREQNEYYATYKQALSAAVKGTVIVEEFYDEQKHKVKNVVKVNEETGKVTYNEKNEVRGGYGRVKSEIVPLLHFYPNENYAEIKGDCVRFNFPTIDEFQKKYGKFPNAASVVSGVNVSDVEGIDYQRLAEDKEHIVEVLKYYNEDDDEFIILANGVWINPQEGEEEGEEQVSPLPYNHKRLPFAKTVYELADEEEFYGKALPDLMTGEQETINAILRMIVDREVLALNRPLLVGLGGELESYQIVPGGVLSMSGDIGQARELDLSDAGQAPFSLMEFLVRRSNVNTSIDPMSQGVATGGRKTAREAMLLNENSKEMASSFQLFIFKLLVERAKLRVQNIKQFYKEPIQWTPIYGEGGVPKTDENGEKLTRPKYRTVISEETGRKPRYLEISPQMCRANFFIRTEEDFYQSKSQLDRMERAQALLMESKQNPLLDAEEVTLNWLIAFGHNPKKYYKGLGKKTRDQMMGNLGESKMEQETSPIPEAATSQQVPGQSGIPGARPS